MNMRLITWNTEMDVNLILFEGKNFYYFLLRSEKKQKMFSNLFTFRSEMHALQNGSRFISFRFEANKI
jgi:hypothetical protein